MINSNLINLLKNDELNIKTQFDEHCKKIKEEWMLNTSVSREGLNKVYKFKVNIIPKRVMRNYQCYYITKIHKKYKIKSVFIYTDQKNRIIEIKIGKGQYHVNVDPKTNIVCLPKYFKNLNINEPSLFYSLNWILTSHRMDSCYFPVDSHHIKTDHQSNI